MADITCELSGGIAEVRLARPEKLNALTLPMLQGLIGTARSLASDRSVRVVVISADGDSFCAGLDFADTFGQRTAVVKGMLPRPWRGTNTFQEACWAWRRLPVPVIAAVQGHCFGGGVQIALGADFRITTPDAKWSVLEGKWGLIPDMSGIAALTQLIGIEQAKRLTMTAEVFSGERARELGLVSQVSLDPNADAWALARELTTRSLTRSLRRSGSSRHAGTAARVVRLPGSAWSRCGYSPGRTPRSLARQRSRGRALPSSRAPAEVGCAFPTVSSSRDRR